MFLGEFRTLNDLSYSYFVILKNETKNAMERNCLLNLLLILFQSQYNQKNQIHPVNKHMFKFNIRNTRKSCQIRKQIYAQSQLKKH